MNQQWQKYQKKLNSKFNNFRFLYFSDNTVLSKGVFMENEYKLKDITEINEDAQRKYVLNFSDGKAQEEIILSGQGKIKEPLKI